MRTTFALTGGLLLGTAGMAQADSFAGRIDYDVSIAGVPIGDLRVITWIAERNYNVSYRLDYRFLVWSGTGGGQVDGVVDAGNLIPQRYRVQFASDAARTIEVAFGGDGIVSDFSITPPFDSEEDSEPRVPLEPAHLIGVVDPITAMVVHDLAGGRVETDLCRSQIGVFNGVARFDLEPAGIEVIAPGHVECAVRYVPVAGHRTESEMIDRMADEVLSFQMIHDPTLAAWIVSRMVVPSDVGDLLIERQDPE